MSKFRIRGRVRTFYTLNYIGLVVGLLFAFLSMTPSLLPRATMLQGVLVGLCFVIGYGVGVVISWVARHVFHARTPASFRRVAWYGLWTLLPITLVMYGSKAVEWQNQTRALVGLDPLGGNDIVKMCIFALIVGTIVLAICRLVALGVRELAKLTSRWIPPRIGWFIGVVVMAVVVFLFIKGVAIGLGAKLADHIYADVNKTTPAGLVRPTDNSLRSGGPGSVVLWDSLGKQGRRFIGAPINAKQISQTTGLPAKEPIRVYIGVETSRDPKYQAELAVRELDRTDAWARQELLVVTPTGTGWIEPQIADSFDYVYGGDTATVAIQYSYLPSWISFIVDKQRAADAGRELFNAVYDKWKTLPENARPKLIVHGLSLGSYGMQEPFGDANDLANRVDGALFAGTPNSTALWRQFEKNRDVGSPEWQPVYDNGQTVRWFSHDNDFASPDAPWTYPRIGYLQHPSDGVVWWDWDLLWTQPDWLQEPRGYDVNPGMHWYPVVTFFQVLVDQAVATKVPSGHGHNYENFIVDNWQSILPSPNLTPDAAKKIQDIINTYPLT